MSKNKQPKMAFTRKPCVIATGIAISLMAAQTFAQTPAPAPATAVEKVEKIEVTGSRIPAANLESTSPIATIDAQSIKVDGVRNVENLLNNLPQVFADQGGTVSNGASGTASVNLRGLGPTRTLVLVNGRRLPAGNPRSFAADLNQIPAPLIKRIEVLTGGGGAVYGSDAIAGVVNFIMNDKFEGVQIEANQSFYNHKQQNEGGVADIVAARARTNAAQFNVPGNKSADGKSYDLSLLMGSNFANGKGNATVFFNYKKDEALLQSERDYSACALGTSETTDVINGTTFGPGFRCGGSNTSFPGRFRTFLDTGATRNTRTVLDAAGNTRAFDATRDQYNFAPTNYYQRPSERYGFNAFGNYDIAEGQKVYTEFSFHDDRTVAQIAPSGLFGLLLPAGSVSCDNPLLSAAWRTDLGCTGTTGTAPFDLLINRRNVEGGGRQDDIRNTSYRMVVGVKGEFAKGWNYDAFIQDGRVSFQETYKNDFSVARSTLALDVVRDANGNIACRSGPPCVPYNIFSLGGVTPAALAYLQTPGFQRGTTDQKVQSVTINGDLGEYGWKLPSAQNGIAIGLGIERRTEKLSLDTDTAFSTGDLFGQGGPTIGLSGGYTVRDFFGEVRAPLIEGAAFADLLSVNASYRKSDYSFGPKANTYGFGIEWAPVKQVRGRASYQQAVRAPNVIDQFSAVGQGLFAAPADPCGATRQATAAQCARTGLAADLYGTEDLDNPAGQYNAIFGGSTKLSPEESKSFTFGAVFQLSKNFSASIDYFDIKIEKVIGSQPYAILAQCLKTGDPAFCNLIRRDQFGSLHQVSNAADGTPNGITALNANQGTTQTSGIDVSLNYVQPITNFGSIKTDFSGTWLRSNKFQALPGVESFECKGLHGTNCGVPSPEWRHKARLTWATPWNFDISGTWRYVGKVEQEFAGSQLLFGFANPSVNVADRTLGARNYFDLAGSWNATKALTVSLGINNLFDRDPPLGSQGVLAASFGNGNTYPQVYDALGRRVFLNATYKF
jgi:iron complex outermembrane recepter protein